MQKWGKQASLRNSHTPLAADYLQKRRIRGHQAAPTCGKPHFRTDPPPGSRQPRNTQNYLNWRWYHRIAIRRPQRPRNWKISQNCDEQASEQAGIMVGDSDYQMIGMMMRYEIPILISTRCGLLPAAGSALCLIMLYESPRRWRGWGLLERPWSCCRPSPARSSNTPFMIFCLLVRCPFRKCQPYCFQKFQEMGCFGSSPYSRTRLSQTNLSLLLLSHRIVILEWSEISDMMSWFDPKFREVAFLQAIGEVKQECLFLSCRPVRVLWCCRQGVDSRVLWHCYSSYVRNKCDWVLRGRARRGLRRVEPTIKIYF